MTYFNDQFNKFVEFQTTAFQPAREYYGAAAETFEKLTRQHYEVMGDFVNFAVQQAKLPTEVQNANEYAGKQAEQARAFGQKLIERYLGYVDIARAAQAQTTEAVAAEVKKAA